MPALQGFIDDHKPATENEGLLVECLAQAHWGKGLIGIDTSGHALGNSQTFRSAGPAAKHLSTKILGLLPRVVIFFARTTGT